MRTIQLSRSPLFFWQQLVFLEAALLACDETKHLAAPVTAALDSFNTLQGRDLGTQRALIQALARAALADNDLDEGIRKVHNNALHLVGQDRKRREFVTLFAGSIGKLIRYALKRQLELAAELVGNRALPLFEQAFRDTQIGLLQPLIDKGKTVLESRRTAEHERLSARIEIQDWKQEASSVQLAVYGELLAIAAATGRSKSWADVFFPTRATRAAADEIEEAALEAAAGGEAEAPAEE